LEPGKKEILITDRLLYNLFNRVLYYQESLY